MTIGEKIKRLRLERGMTQEELGKAVGVQKAAINKYETGIVVNLKREIIQKLARTLDVNPVWLMDEEDGWPPTPSTSALIQQAIEKDKNLPKNDDIRLLIRGLNKLTPAQIEQATNVFRAMFEKTNPDLFKGDDDK